MQSNTTLLSLWLVSEIILLFHWEIDSVIINYTWWGVCGLFTQVYIVKMVKVNRIYASMKVWVYSEFTKGDKGGRSYLFLDWPVKWRYFVSYPVYNKNTEFSLAEPTCSTSDFSEPATSKYEVDLSELSQQIFVSTCFVSLLWKDVWCFWGCWKRFFASELETKRIMSYVDEPFASQTAHWKTVCSEPTSFFELAGNP